MAYPYTLRVPYTLSLMANVGRDVALNTIKRGFVAEFDCELVVEYEDTDNWEVDHIRFEQTRWNEEYTVSPTSDPDLWKLVERALEYDWKDLGDKVRELIVEAWYDRRDEVGDHKMQLRKEAVE